MFKQSELGINTHQKKITVDQIKKKEEIILSSPNC